jgi:GNAT superfamily N-acetyltransferase
MFQVKVMSVGDYDFAVDLANTMNWGMEAADFGFNQFLEPDGCLILFDGSVPVGIATCITFGSVGWFGTFIVKQGYRRRGAGYLLLEHAITYLKSKDVRTIGLYSYSQFEEYYAKFGFKKDNIGVMVMYTNCMQPIDCGSFNFESQPDFSVLTRFDHEFFGADRSCLLKSILHEKSSLCYASFDGSNMLGYVMSKNCGNVSEVGPLVCCPGRSDVAFGLLKVMLQGLVNRPVALYLSQGQEEVFEEFLLGVGFGKSFSLSRMFLGESIVQNGVYLVESLERG